MKKENGRIILDLGMLPVSNRTTTVNNSFMLSDNIDSSETINMAQFYEKSDIIVDSPFRIDFTCTLICLHGSVTFRIRDDFTLSKGGMITVIQGTIIEFVTISSDAKLIMMAYSSDFEILNPKFRPTPEVLTYIARHPHIRLSDIEIQSIVTVYNMLRDRLADPNFTAKEDMALNCMRLIYSYTSNHMISAETDYQLRVSRHHKVLDDFLRLVELHSIEHREISFYADKLCMTPKYLSRIVCATSGRPAYKWICERIILEAKTLLSENELTIQQISDRLNFSNQSFFGSFFRRHTGVSPKNYRSAASDKAAGRKLNDLSMISGCAIDPDNC